MQTNSSAKLKVSALAAVLAAGLVGCDGGSYESTTGRLTMPGADARSAAPAGSSATEGRGAAAYAAGDARGSATASAAQGYAAANGGAAVAPVYPIDTSVDTSTFNRAPAVPAVGPNGEPAAKPELANVSPSSGPAEGGNEVTLTGSGFANVQVLWGTVIARVTSQSSNAVTVIVPEGAAGSLTTAVVTNRDGTYAVRPSAYSYN